MKKQDVITLIDMHLAWLAEQPNVDCDIKPITRIYFKNIPVDVFKEVCEELELKYDLEYLGSYLTADIKADKNNTISLLSQEVETLTTWRAK